MKRSVFRRSVVWRAIFGCVIVGSTFAWFSWRERSPQEGSEKVSSEQVTFEDISSTKSSTTPTKDAQSPRPEIVCPPGIEIVPSERSQRHHIFNKLVESAAEKVGVASDEVFVDMSFVARDGEEIIGGVNGCVWFGSVLSVEHLFVEEKYRDQKIGSKLLQVIENEAKNMGIKLVDLQTFSFQAKDFYLKNGYTVFAVVDNFPRGHKRYYLKKEL